VVWDGEDPHGRAFVTRLERALGDEVTVIW
jgi:hypothetical protein